MSTTNENKAVKGASQLDLTTYFIQTNQHILIEKIAQLQRTKKKYVKREVEETNSKPCAGGEGEGGRGGGVEAGIGLFVTVLNDHERLLTQSQG